MAKLLQEQPYQDPWNLESAEVRRQLREFEKDINSYYGPWKYDLWLLAHNHIVKDINFRLLDITLPDGRVCQKPEYTSVRNMQNVALKYQALKKLQRRTEFAKEQEAKEIPLPEPDMSDPELLNLFK